MDLIVCMLGLAFSQNINKLFRNVQQGYNSRVAALFPLKLNTFPELHFLYFLSKCTVFLQFSLNHIYHDLSNSPLAEEILNAAADNMILCSAATQTGTEQ